MKKLIFLLCIYICINLCGCQRTVPENDLVLAETEQNAPEEKATFLDGYAELVVAEDVKRVSLIYLDEDDIPELLVLKDGEYHLYSFDGLKVTAIAMPATEIKANAYGQQHNFDWSDEMAFYWFEYVPYQGLIRVHSGADEEREDYYLRYANGLLSIELEVKSDNSNTWYTYDAEKEISNEEFLSQLSALGYDKLIPCGYLYENVADAYESIGTVSDTGKVLDDFVNGKMDALDYVDGISDIPEDSFVMKSYADFYEEITAGDEFWGDVEYMDFDNDDEDELIIHGYTGACLFFDVIGDTVYKVLETGTTTDFASVAVLNGKKVIERSDFLYVGRTYYWIMEFDACCCVVDWWELHASYEGERYSEEDEFMYRDRETTMEEFEEIVSSIQQP